MNATGKTAFGRLSASARSFLSFGTVLNFLSHFELSGALLRVYS